ncbi:MAG: hypothetical protein IJ867_00700 [Clostridia bacterium]|nr:hypothetical protein [Clostridia bacterium]
MKKKIILSVIFIIIVLIIIVIGSKLVISKNICKKLDEFAKQKNTYFVITTYYYGNNNPSFGVVKTWQDADNYRALHEITNFSLDSQEATIEYIYLDSEKNEHYSKKSDGEIVLENSYSRDEIEKEDNTTLNSGIAIGTKEDLSNIFKFSLSSGVVNGTECYIIKVDKGKRIIYIDKDTGLPVRQIIESKEKEYNDYRIMDYYYEFDVVTDSDFIF